MNVERNKLPSPQSPEFEPRSTDVVSELDTTAQQAAEVLESEPADATSAFAELQDLEDTYRNAA